MIYIYIYTKPDNELNTYAIPTLVTLPDRANKRLNPESNKRFFYGLQNGTIM